MNNNKTNNYAEDFLFGALDELETSFYENLNNKRPLKKTNISKYVEDHIECHYPGPGVAKHIFYQYLMGNEVVQRRLENYVLFNNEDSALIDGLDSDCISFLNSWYFHNKFMLIDDMEPTIQGYTDEYITECTKMLFSTQGIHEIKNTLIDLCTKVKVELLKLEEEIAADKDLGEIFELKINKKGIPYMAVKRTYGLIDIDDYIYEYIYHENTLEEISHQISRDLYPDFLKNCFNNVLPKLDDAISKYVDFRKYPSIANNRGMEAPSVGDVIYRINTIQQSLQEYIDYINSDDFKFCSFNDDLFNSISNKNDKKSNNGKIPLIIEDNNKFNLFKYFTEDMYKYVVMMIANIFGFTIEIDNTVPASDFMNKYKLHTSRDYSNWDVYSSEYSKEISNLNGYDTSKLCDGEKLEPAKVLVRKRVKD